MIKKKFRSAEEKRKQEELAAAWAQLNAKWIKSSPARGQTAPKKSTPAVFRRETVRVPSHGMNGVATKPVQGKTYTGSAIVGIGTLHKSNAVPIFNSEAAVDIARMRRG